jgi:hypothetical protein
MHIGKYGKIARMNNPKLQSGPIARKFHPTRTGRNFPQSH